jgi:predicted  nucleic acid-binding Zn-ribbon protein
LKNKEEIVRNLRDIERIRKNLSAVNISADSTPDDLEAINKDLEYYIQQFEVIEKNLQNYKVSYKDSFSDVFFSEQILFVAESFVISIRQQQNLIRELGINREEAKKLFYSSYLIPVYYYLTLGDNMIAYIETYFRIT